MHNIPTAYAIPGIIKTEYTLLEAIFEISKVTGISTNAITSRSRQRKVVTAKHLLYKLLRDSGWTYKAIASVTGIDHTSVMYAIKKIDNGQSPEIDEILKSNFLLTNFKIKKTKQ